MALQSLAALSDDEINELKEDFLKADANKDGALDKQEFSKLLASRVKVCTSLLVDHPSFIHSFISLLQL